MGNNRYLIIKSKSNKKWASNLLLRVNKKIIESEILLKKKEKEDRRKMEEKKRIVLEEKIRTDKANKIKKNVICFIKGTIALAFFCLATYILLKIYILDPIAKLVDNSNINNIESAFNFGKIPDENDEEGKTSLWWGGN